MATSRNEFQICGIQADYDAPTFSRMSRDRYQLLVVRTFRRPHSMYAGTRNDAIVGLRGGYVLLICFRPGTTPSDDGHTVFEIGKGAASRITTIFQLQARPRNTAL